MLDGTSTGLLRPALRLASRRQVHRVVAYHGEVRPLLGCVPCLVMESQAGGDWTVRSWMSKSRRCVGVQAPWAQCRAAGDRPVCCPRGGSGPAVLLPLAVGGGVATRPRVSLASPLRDAWRRRSRTVGVEDAAVAGTRQLGRGGDGPPREGRGRLVGDGKSAVTSATDPGKVSGQPRGCLRECGKRCRKLAERWGTTAGGRATLVGAALARVVQRGRSLPLSPEKDGRRTP